MHSNNAVFADTATGKNHPDWFSQSELGPANSATTITTITGMYLPYSTEYKQNNWIISRRFPQIQEHTG
jgi:hypothetical protein